MFCGGREVGGTQREVGNFQLVVSLPLPLPLLWTCPKICIDSGMRAYMSNISMTKLWTLKITFSKPPTLAAVSTNQMFYVCDAGHPDCYVMGKAQCNYHSLEPP